MLHDQKQTSEDWLELVNQELQSSRLGVVQPYWRLASRVCHQVKAIATESVWVVEVLLCWLVALPVVLLSFFGLILWEKIEAVIPVRLSFPNQFSRRNNFFIERKSSSTNAA
jgi:hypothetical protein